VQKVHDTAGTQFFFKPRFDLMAPEFDREVSVLGAIRSTGLNSTLRVSPFKGLVLLDSGLVAGMLFGWLEGWPLAEHLELSNPGLHKRWQEQVEGIVKELHQHEIVWGDVNVHNIFIDVDGDAWVIDFGGNCNVQFVDEELKETVEGDVQGLRRVFEEWLPVAGKL
jgi:tRNA A-37 threonylcarbamoyl transferase component Bud32